MAENYIIPPRYEDRVFTVSSGDEYKLHPMLSEGWIVKYRPETVNGYQYVIVLTRLLDYGTIQVEKKEE